MNPHYQKGKLFCRFCGVSVEFSECHRDKRGVLIHFCGKRVRSESLSNSSSRKPRLDSGYEGLLRRCWCPVCGVSLKIEEVNGKKTLVCPTCGEMNAYLNKNPRGASE